MKLILILTVLATAAIGAAAGASSPATYVAHGKVEAALAEGGALVSTNDYLVSGSHRSAAGQVEVHEKETDVIYVTGGSATFVTGGTMIGGKPLKTGQMLGTDIQGGETHQLTKGDVVVVPAGTPHWFKEVPSEVSYFVVKVLSH